VYICSARESGFDEVPEGMITRELPEQTYARFTHRGPVAELEKTLRYIGGSKLPKSRYDYEERPDFKLYPAGFSDADPQNKLYLNIPISAKD